MKPAKIETRKLATITASHLYAGILDVIEAMDYDVFSGRAYVRTPGKMRSISRAALGFVRMCLLRGYTEREAG